jgi:Na+-transporting NADH:ubiquinone oxidoreductase subunit C
MKFNRESNLYTIIYSAVLVLLVGVLLSVVYQALKPKQDENVANDKKSQILAAALIVPTKEQSVAELYKEHITAKVVNSRGYDVKGANAFDVNVSEQVKKDDNNRLLPVYICTTDNGTKYIIPVYGAGLWGPIWGYIAFNNDGTSIYGAYFAHEGETPGLGAEIEKPKFQEQFQGKAIYDNGNFTSVKVVKNGQEPTDGTSFVHAVSGGTITSQGVQKMLENSLRPYDAYFKKLQSAKQ